MPQFTVQQFGACAKPHGLKASNETHSVAVSQMLLNDALLGKHD